MVTHVEPKDQILFESMFQKLARYQEHIDTSIESKNRLAIVHDIQDKVQGFPSPIYFEPTREYLCTSSATVTTNPIDESLNKVKVKLFLFNDILVIGKSQKRRLNSVRDVRLNCSFIELY